MAVRHLQVLTAVWVVHLVLGTTGVIRLDLVLFQNRMGRSRIILLDLPDYLPICPGLHPESVGRLLTFHRSSTTAVAGAARSASPSTDTIPVSETIAAETKIVVEMTAEGMIAGETTADVTIAGGTKGTNGGEMTAAAGNMTTVMPKIGTGVGATMIIAVALFRARALVRRVDAIIRVKSVIRDATNATPGTMSVTRDVKSAVQGAVEGAAAPAAANGKKEWARREKK